MIFRPAALHGPSKPSLPIHRGLNPILHVSATRFFKLNLRSQSRYNLPSYSKTPHCLKTSICAEPTRSLASTPATLESGLWSLGQRLASLYKKNSFLFPPGHTIRLHFPAFLEWPCDSDLALEFGQKLHALFPGLSHNYLPCVSPSVGWMSRPRASMKTMCSNGKASLSLDPLKTV